MMKDKAGRSLTGAAVLLMAGAPAAADIEAGAPAWGPDVMGGYSSSRVVARLAPGAAGLAAGRAGIGIAPADAVLAKYGAVGVAPAIAGFADPALAAAIGLDRYVVIELPPGSDTPGLVGELAAMGDVFESVSLDGVGGPADLVPNDPDFALQWSMQNTGQLVDGFESSEGADISGPAAWALASGAPRIILAVIDTGISPHEELAGRVIAGWNTTDDSALTIDECDHGTHVSGIAGAHGNNGVGVAGVNWGVRFLPVRVLDGCWGVESQTAAGIVYAADHGASVANISLQFYTGTDLLRDAVEYAHASGVLLVAASGNSAGAKIAYPAKFPGCMAIGATNPADGVPGFSNYGPELDMVAPGVKVWSLKSDGTYRYATGTSMAAPHVAGAASLIWTLNPALTHDEVAAILSGTADDLLEAGWDAKSGAGRLNLHSALLATPCYADVDGDGSVTIFDVLRFQTLFAAGDRGADCDRGSGVGVLDLFDFLCYYGAFLAGCP